MLPLEGTRIVELGLGPVSGLATMILADFGAEVVRIEPPAGDPFRSLASYPMWTRGKSIVAVDLKNTAERTALIELILGSAEGVLTTLNREQRQRYQLDHADLVRTRPDLVYGRISGFGDDSAFAGIPGLEPLIAAISGRMMSFEGAAGHPGPNYAALQVGVHATAQIAATALMAALHDRRLNGRGKSFDTSLLRGMLPYDLSGLQTAQLAEKGIIDRPKQRQDPRKVMPRIYYHAARTRDGRWLQLGNLLPHLQDNFYRAAGIELPEDGIPEDGPALERFRDQLLSHIASRDLADWMALFVADGGIVAHPYQTTQEALDDPDLVANGHVVTTSAGRQLGPVARLTRTPGRVGEPARALSIEQLPARVPSATGTAAPAARPAAPAARPLTGITIVEAATIIAAPLGAASLADLGARVIKLEPLGGDPFRGMMHGIGAAKCNTGKESICLDLKSAEGQEIAAELARRADIFIHNYRPGVPEKLGIGYQTLSASNDQLVYLSVNGYGPDGPGAHRPSTHPIPGAALGGVVWQMGGLPGPGPMTIDEIREVTRRLFRANEVNPDPNTSMVVTTAAMLGLLARASSGKGQAVFIDMFGANAWANWDDFLSYDGKPERPSVDPEQHGLGPFFRLYECRQGWVFLAALTAEAQTSLGSSDAEALAARFRTRDADAWISELNRPGLACVRADAGWPADFLLGEADCRTEELIVAAQHDEWGAYYRHGPLSRFEQGGSYAGASLPGDATRSLLVELGYRETDISALIDADRVRAFATT